MKMRFSYLLVLLMSSLQGCLSDDDDDSSSNSSSNCDDDALDPDLYGVWLKHTYHDLTMENSTSKPTEKGPPIVMTGFDQACWYIDGDELIYEKIYPQQGKVLWHSNYYIDGDLLFYSQVFSESIDINGVNVGNSYNDKPTECYLFHKMRRFLQITQL